jgi:type IV pilus assembly protein PilC
MATFSYIALDSKNNPVNGTLDQPDRNSAINALTKQNLRPISIKETKSKKSGIDLNNLFSSNKVKSEQLVMFTRQLSTMIGAGVPILRALTSMASHLTESPALKKILTNVIRDVEAGATLGDALAKYPATFDDIYVNMVRAGETAGILDDILKQLAAQQEKSSKMHKKIRSSMAYPVVLLSITVIAFFGLMIFIIPQLGKILKDLGGPDTQLPALTLFMLGVSSFIIQYWYAIIAVIVLIIFAFSSYSKTPKGRFQIDSLLLKTPVIKNLIMKTVIARFTRTFSALIEAGVAVLEALSVTSRAVGNSVYKAALDDAEVKVKNGKSLSSVIEANPLFPPIVSQMLAVGEETGQTGTVLVKVAEYYEEEVDVAIGGLSTIIEPIMIVIMGAMVGLIAASVMLPIAGMAQSIK